MRIVGLLVVVVGVGGCGRIGFEPGGDAAVTDGLRLWLPFDGAAPRRDVAGGRDATCTTCPSGTPGPRGDAAAFDGAACLAVADAPEFSAPGFTLALWVRRDVDDGASVFGHAIDGATSLFNRWELWLPNTGRLYFQTSHASASNDKLDAPAPALGEWHHVAATFSATRKALYVDGTRVGEEFGPGAPLRAGHDPVRVGCDRDDGVEAQHLVGALDDVRFYDRVLDDAEVAALAVP